MAYTFSASSCSGASPVCLESAAAAAAILKTRFPSAFFAAASCCTCRPHHVDPGRLHTMAASLSLESSPREKNRSRCHGATAEEVLANDQARD